MGLHDDGITNVACSGVTVNKVARQMCLLLAVQYIAWPIYRPYSMHPAKQHTHYSCSAFKSDSFYNIQGIKAFVIEMGTTASR